jgi:hypothetical protein
VAAIALGESNTVVGRNKVCAGSVPPDASVFGLKERSCYRTPQSRTKEDSEVQLGGSALVWILVHLAESFADTGRFPSDKVLLALCSTHTGRLERIDDDDR